MTQPTNPLIRIAENDVNTPSTGLPNKKEPSNVLQTIGWDKDQIVAGNHLNYILDNLAEYIAWLQEQVALTATKEYIDQQDSDIKNTTLTAGDGIDGGGDLTADRSFSVDNTVVRTDRTLTAGDGINGGGDLTADRSFTVDNSVVRTNRTINGQALTSDITLASTDITGSSTSVLTGTIAHGGTIPFPAGYTVGQCSFMVSLNDSGTDIWDLQESLSHLHYRTTCSVTTSGVVHAQRQIFDHAGETVVTAATANYMVIGVK